MPGGNPGRVTTPMAEREPLAGRTMMFNVRTHQWQDEILAAVGLDRSRLAPAQPSGTVVGTIAAAVARDLGLPHNVPVVAGGHDQPCGALGAGIVEPGRAMGPQDQIDRYKRVFGVGKQEEIEVLV